MNELIEKFAEIDMDEFANVVLLAKYFEEWCRWNKSYEDIDVFRSTKFRTIVVIHNLWDRHISIYNSWDFLKDVIYFIDDYITESEEDYKYCLDFWKERFDYFI